MSPKTKNQLDCNDMNTHDKGFCMHFHAGIHKVVLDIKKVYPLLAKVREISELDNTPDGCQGCKDCEILEKLVGIVSVSAQ
jgi:hypothetical protein